MTNRKRIVKIILLALLVQLLMVQSMNDYTSVYAGYGELFSTDEYIAKRLNYAFEMYGPGDYFSKNGKACTCHSRNKCVANGPDCNCLRYVYIDGEKCDLRAVQCMGYATYMQQVLFGCNEFTHSSKFKKLSGPGVVDGNGVKKWFVENASILHPGTHIRVKWTEHSISLMAVDYDKGTVTYIDNNWVARCKINDFVTLTWSEFATKFKSINYAKVYKNYYSDFDGAPDAEKISRIQEMLPTSTPTVKATKTPTPTISPKPANYSIGVYEVTTNPGSNLNLRADTDTHSEIVSKILSGTRVEILDFVYNKNGHHWGLIPVEEGSGWVAMEYLKLVATITPTPTNTPVPADYPLGQYEVRVNNKLNIRESYSTNSIIIGALPNGRILEMFEFVKGPTGSDWGAVVTDDNLRGWVSMDYLHLLAEYTPTPNLKEQGKYAFLLATDTPTPFPVTPTMSPTVSPSCTPTPMTAVSVNENTLPPAPTKIPQNEFTFLENITGRGNNQYINENKWLLFTAIICVAAEALLYSRILKKRNRSVIRASGKE